MSKLALDSLKTLRQLSINGHIYHYYSVACATSQQSEPSHLPFSIKALLENLLRHEDGVNINENDLQALLNWPEQDNGKQKFYYYPTRVVIDQVTAVPTTVELVSLQQALVDCSEHTSTRVPSIPTDIIVNLDSVSHSTAADREARSFLESAQRKLPNLQLFPIEADDYSQLNIKHLTQVTVTAEKNLTAFVHSDSCIGSPSLSHDSGAFGVLAWANDDISLQMATLGLPSQFTLPEVIGIQLTGTCNELLDSVRLGEVISTQLAELDTKESIVEFSGNALANLALSHRIALCKALSELPVRCCFFPVDDQTLTGLRSAGRSEEELNLIESYSKAQDLWRDNQPTAIQFSHTIEINLDPFTQAPADNTPAELTQVAEFSIKQLTTTKQLADNNIQWAKDSAYIQPSALPIKCENIQHHGIQQARILALFDDINTDSIAPSHFAAQSPAAQYLSTLNTVTDSDSRYQDFAANAEIVSRGTFADPSLENHILVDTQGGYSRHIDSFEAETIFDVAQRYHQTDTPLVVFAGQTYGQGNAQCRAAKGSQYLGIKAVISQSFDESHRTNLANLGILPLQLIDGDCWRALSLCGEEVIDIELPSELYPMAPVVLTLTRPNGRKMLVELDLMLETEQEVLYIQHSGFMNYAYQQLSQS